MLFKRQRQRPTVQLLTRSPSYPLGQLPYTERYDTARLPLMSYHTARARSREKCLPLWAAPSMTRGHINGHGDCPRVPTGYSQPVLRQPCMTRIQYSMHHIYIVLLASCRFLTPLPQALWLYSPRSESRKSYPSQDGQFSRS